MPFVVGGKLRLEKFEDILIKLELARAQTDGTIQISLDRSQKVVLGELLRAITGANDYVIMDGSAPKGAVAV